MNFKNFLEISGVHFQGVLATISAPKIGKWGSKAPKSSLGPLRHGPPDFSKVLQNFLKNRRGHVLELMATILASWAAFFRDFAPKSSLALLENEPRWFLKTFWSPFSRSGGNDFGALDPFFPMFGAEIVAIRSKTRTPGLKTVVALNPGVHVDFTDFRDTQTSLNA